MIHLPSWFPQSLLMAAILVIIAILLNKFDASYRAGWRFVIITSISLLAAGAFAPAPLAHFLLLAVAISGLAYGLKRNSREAVNLSLLLASTAIVAILTSPESKCIFFTC